MSVDRPIGAQSLLWPADRLDEALRQLGVRSKLLASIDEPPTLTPPASPLK